jgi:hypothetical protein
MNAPVGGEGGSAGTVEEYRASAARTKTTTMTTTRTTKAHFGNGIFIKNKWRDRLKYFLHGGGLGTTGGGMNGLSDMHWRPLYPVHWPKPTPAQFTQ